MSNEYLLKIKQLLLKSKPLLLKAKPFLIALLGYLDIIYFVIIVTIKALSYDKEITPYFSYKTSIIPLLASILILASFTVLFKNKIRARILYVLNIIISIIIIADTAYFRYSQDVISLATVKNGTMLGGVQASVSSLLQLKDFVYLADAIILIPILFLTRKAALNSLKFVKRFAIFAIVILVGLAIDAKSISALDAEQPRLLGTMFNKPYIIQKLGNVNFHVLDAYNVTKTAVSTMKTLDSQKEQDIKSYLKTKDIPKGTALKGVGKGKNLIFIQVEALQQFVINQKINGAEITPNLNKWLGKSLYFDNYFYQVAEGNTSDAEFLSNNSLYPAASGAVYNTYCGNTYNSLAKELNDNGYYTAALHGYKEGFWNRNIMYKAEKFDDFFGQSSYKMDETVGMGLSDKSFLKQDLAKLETFKQPYFAFNITLSSHYPFNDIAGYGSFDVGEYKNTLLGNYLTAIHYTDEQLGTYLDALQSEGILDNSIVVLYGDHFAIPKNEIDSLYKFENIKNPTDLDWYELQKVPMFIHFPNDDNKGVNHIYAGQIDLYPTVSNILGLQNKYTFGEDLINTTDNLVKFRNGSFSDGKSFYVSYSDTYYDIANKKQISETPELKAMKNTTLTELEYSDDILTHNLIKSFLKEDSIKK